MFKDFKLLLFCILSIIFVMHSFSYGFLFYNKNLLSWFTSCMAVLFLKIFRYHWSIIKTPFSFKCLLKSELEIFVWRLYNFSSPCLSNWLSPGLSGFKNSCVRVLEIKTLRWEHFLSKNGCLGFVFIIPIVIMT